MNEAGRPHEHLRTGRSPMNHENEPPKEDAPQPTVELPVGETQPLAAAEQPAGWQAGSSSETPGEQATPPGEHTAPPAEHVPAPTEQFPPATDHGYVTPPLPPPPPVTPGGGGGGGGYGPGPQEPRRRHRGKLVAAIVIGVLLLGGVAFAGVMLVTKSSAAPDKLAGMVPASDQLYATAYLDPGADQKINLRDLLQRFPAMQGKDPVQKLDETLEQLLKPTGLSYTADVKPWLGTQIAVSGKLDDSGNPDAAVLIASKDD